MGTACEMRALSSLELMLMKLQHAEERPEDTPPALPARPVMKVRQPRQRKKLPFVFNSNSELHQMTGKSLAGIEKNGFLDTVSQLGLSEVHAPIDFNKDVKDEEEGGLQEGVMIIQRCYRGYQAYSYYRKFKSGAIALQSCIRGWLARREFVKQVVSQEANKSELTKVPIIVLLELGRKVLISEAALERKRDESSSLKKLIADYEMTWRQHEARMQYLETMWQDELTSIQTSLAEARKQQALAGDNGPSRSIEITSGRVKIKPFVVSHPEMNNEIKPDKEVSSFSPKDELAKLKLKFEAWTKGYRKTLQEAKARMKKLGQPAKRKSSGIWCGR
ncbi:unnamed protein product [Cuscuta europaea]|uniref:Uncharacterized protein n=1 Tax=Cuscuta europaea TaxID=41803 RepID=A0A9P0Z0S3_CUSEU|nr:unnamed protein product [Cuscuta europaea]